MLLSIMTKQTTNSPKMSAHTYKAEWHHTSDGSNFS